MRLSCCIIWEYSEIYLTCKRKSSNHIVHGYLRCWILHEFIIEKLGFFPISFRLFFFFSYVYQDVFLSTFSLEREGHFSYGFSRRFFHHSMFFIYFFFPHEFCHFSPYFHVVRAMYFFSHILPFHWRRSVSFARCVLGLILLPCLYSCLQNNVPFLLHFHFSSRIFASFVYVFGVPLLFFSLLFHVFATI